MNNNQSNAKQKLTLPLLWVAILVICVGGLGAFFYHHKSTPAPGTVPAVAEIAENPPETPPEPIQPVVQPAAVATEIASAKKLPKAANPGYQAPIIPHTEATPLTRQLVGALARPDLSAMTAEQAVQWKNNLAQLVQQGPTGVAAIREFLSQNVDMDFSGAGQALGYSSARAAMFEALQQIGGPEAVSAMTGVLQTTADPKEIALLARNLAQQDPELYRGEVLNAVHEALAMARSKDLEGSDVGPLFEVLQKYGGPGAISDLEEASGQWKYYATLSLAQLPDGAGIPALVQMVEDLNGTGRGARDAALQMLAQMAAQYPAARAALVEQARTDKIPASMWAYLTSPLAGDQFQVQDSVLGGGGTTVKNSDLRTTHIAYGNQNFISAPVANLTPDQINQQMSLIDDLLAVTSNPAALQALQQAKATLSTRLPQTAAVGK